MRQKLPLRALTRPGGSPVSPPPYHSILLVDNRDLMHELLQRQMTTLASFIRVSMEGTLNPDSSLWSVDADMPDSLAISSLDRPSFLRSTRKPSPLNIALPFRPGSRIRVVATMASELRSAMNGLRIYLFSYSYRVKNKIGIPNFINRGSCIFICCAWSGECRTV